MSGITISKQLYPEVEASTYSHHARGKANSGNEAEVPSKLLPFPHSAHIPLIVFGEADPRNFVELRPFAGGENMGRALLDIVGCLAFGFGDANGLMALLFLHLGARES